MIQNIRGKFSFADPLYTKEIEETLDLIATGDADYKQELQKFHLGIESELGQFSKHWLDSFPVYKCKTVMTDACCRKSVPIATKQHRSTGHVIHAKVQRQTEMLMVKMNRVSQLYVSQLLIYVYVANH